MATPFHRPCAVVGGLVAERLEGEGREAVVGQLGLLHAEDVGLHLGEPLLDASQADLQRVDVPGGDAHAGTLSTLTIRAGRARLPSAAMEALLWRDYLCPWCWLGRSRNQVLVDLGVTVTHLPYDLHPEIPPEGRGDRPGGRLDAVFDHIAAECAEGRHRLPPADPHAEHPPGPRDGRDRPSDRPGELRRTSTTPCSGATGSTASTSATPT